MKLTTAQMILQKGYEVNNSTNDPSKRLRRLHEKYSNQNEKSDADNSIVSTDMIAL